MEFLCGHCSLLQRDVVADILCGSVFQDTLAGTKLARQLDLRDIWRLVQKDVETEYMDDQVGTTHCRAEQHNQVSTGSMNIAQI